MEIKNHFGVYGVCLQEGKLLCIEKTRGPYQNRFDLPGGGQELGGTDRNPRKRGSGRDGLYA